MIEFFKSPNVRQYLVVLAVYAGEIAVGYSSGWSSAALPKFEDQEQSPLSQPITETEASLIGSLVFVGAITGPIFAAFSANVWGRKPCLFVSGAINLSAYLLLVLTRNLAMVFAGRILVGIAVGTLQILNMVYIGEIASKNIRGILLSGAGISSAFGTLLSYSIGPYVTYASTAYIGFGICLCFILGLFIVPESPTFHVIKDNKKKVQDILESLGRPNDVDEVLRTKVIVEKREWTQLFSIETNRRALFITVSLQILQQTSGVVAIVFYSTKIFQIANSSIQPHIATIIIGLTQVTGSFITPFVVERSRRILLLISTAVCCTCLAIFGTYFYLDEIGNGFIKNNQWIPLAALIIYFLGYNMGFSVIPSTLASEMFRSNVRTIGSAVAIISGLICGFGVTTAFGYALAYFGGYVVFWAFSVTCAVAFLFTFFCVPETRGKSLMEIQLMLAGGS